MPSWLNCIDLFHHEGSNSTYFPKDPYSNPCYTQSVITPSTPRTYLAQLTLVFGLLLTIWLRLPFLREGSPYLYREDEAHHFNRIVNMMKSGDLNPHYFHKPSLHFYLRLPAASAGFLWTVKKGEATSLKDIVTSDPFGIADYAFSASHPRILLVSRAFSLALQFASLLLTYLICCRLMNGRCLPFLAALLFAVSPAAISESAVIGVDGVMTFFCLAAVYLGLRALELKTSLALLWCALCAGFAVSSKYNALPIMLVPLMVYFKNKPLNFERALIALLVPWVAFLLASPYILLSLPEFLNQLAYEIWHYGVAGHVGHMAEPGLPQARFYLNWLAKDGLGIVGISLSICGLIFLIRNIKLENIATVLIFPISFFLLMLSQKANFERNMVVIIPFVSIFAAYSLNVLRSNIPKGIVVCLAFLSLAQPIFAAVTLRKSTAKITESRIPASQKIEALAREGNELALDGRLQFPRRLLEVPGVSRTDFSTASAARAFQEGFSYLVVGPNDKRRIVTSGLFEEVSALEGIEEPQRIVRNPSITFLKRVNSPSLSQLKTLAQNSTPFPLLFSKDHSEISFEHEGESHIWLKNAVESFAVKTAEGDTNPKTLHLTIFSPWPNQSLSFLTSKGEIDIDMANNANVEVKIDLDPLKSEHEIFVVSSKVHSPKALGISIDTRRLAFAIKKASI